MSTSAQFISPTTTRPAMVSALVVAPALTVVATVAGYAAQLPFLGAAPLSVYMIVALLAWSPLPFSIPAVMLERDRDAALPGYTGLGRVVRGALLVPYMLTRSSARVEFGASLVGFAVAALLALSHF